MEDQKIPLNILVIGANGGIGRQAVETALAAGHCVTAVLRNPAKLKLQHPNLEVVAGDIMRLETFEGHLKNQDAVISAIGVHGGFFNDKLTSLYSIGNANLLQGMKNQGAGRAFFISASAVEISPLLPFFIRFVAKYIVQKLLKHMYADLRRMETLVKESHTSWTIIRPPRLTDDPPTGRYRFAASRFLTHCFSISRADVAHFMINNIDNEEIFRAVVEIAY